MVGDYCRVALRATRPTILLPLSLDPSPTRGEGIYYKLDKSPFAKGGFPATDLRDMRDLRDVRMAVFHFFICPGGTGGSGASGGYFFSLFPPARSPATNCGYLWMCSKNSSKLTINGSKLTIKEVFRPN
jgi:hypothetical protein